MDNRPLGSNRRLNDKMTGAEMVFFGLGCGGAALLTAVAQTSFFFNFRPFGFAPDLCLALAAVAGLMFGPKCGGIVGLLSGFFLDAFTFSGFSLAIPFYLIVGIVMGLLALPESGLNLARIPLYLVGVSVGALVSATAFVFWACITYSSFNIADLIFKTALPEMLCTVVFSMTVYPLGSLISYIIKKKQGISIK